MSVVRRFLSALPLAVCLSSFCTLGASAPLSDRQAPTKVDSDRLQHDEKRSFTVFSGNVLLTRGSLVMRGDRLELQQLPDGSSRGVLTGSPAHIRQRRSAENEWMVGRAERIDYDSRSEISVLTGNALMLRLAGETERDRISGDRLVYNSAAETYQVESTSSRGRSNMAVMPSPRNPIPPSSRAD